MKTVVLMYHNIVENRKHMKLYDVRLDLFRQQMQYLAKTGNGSILPESEDKNAAFSPKGSSEIRVIVSFDDGFKSWTGDVLTILKEYGIKAYFFVTIEHIQKNLISKQDIRALYDEGMIIGAHGVHHTFLTLMDEWDIFYELKMSKMDLEEIIMDTVRYFSVPRGIYNERLVTVAHRAGYENVFTSDLGVNENIEYLVKRVPITRNTSLKDFNRFASGIIDRKQLLFHRMKAIVKKSLGIRRYNVFRNMVVRKAE